MTLTFVWQLCLTPIVNTFWFNQIKLFKKVHYTMQFQFKWTNFPLSFASQFIPIAIKIIITIIAKTFQYVYLLWLNNETVHACTHPFIASHGMTCRVREREIHIAHVYDYYYINQYRCYYWLLLHSCWHSRVKWNHIVKFYILLHADFQTLAHVLWSRNCKNNTQKNVCVCNMHKRQRNAMHAISRVCAYMHACIHTHTAIHSSSTNDGDARCILIKLANLFY